MSNLTLGNFSVSTLNTLEIMEKSWKFANIIAKSDIIPVHYRNKPENIFIAMQSAYRMNMDPMMVMQNTYMIGGKLGMNSAFAISLANNCGLFESGIKYRLEGDMQELRVTAYANLKNNGEEISFTIGMKEAMAEGWTKNPKYRSLPELMLRYRAATLLIRTHVPEALNGMHTVEELQDVNYAKEVTKEEVKKVETKTQALSNKLDEGLLNEKTENQIENTPKIIEETEPELQVTNMHAELQALVLSKHIPQEMISKWCQKAGVSELSQLDEEKTLSCIEFIQDKYEKDSEII